MTLANALYGTPSTRTKDTDSSAPSGAPDFAELGEQLYDVETSMKPFFTDTTETRAVTLGFTDKQDHAWRTSTVQLAKDTGLQPADVEAIVRADLGHQVAVARRGEEPTDDEIQQWSEKARGAVHALYGDQASELLERTKKFVNQHPELKTILSTGGIGSKSDIVGRLVNHVRKTNFR